MTDNEELKLSEFINNSKTFIGFEFIGNFTINSDFINMFELFCSQGINLLDDYTNYTHLLWKSYGEIIDYYECDKISNSLSLLRRYKIIHPDNLGDAIIKLKYLRENYILYLNRINSEPRKTACRVTSNKKLRQSVFDIHGEKCLRCKTTDNLTIDHVIPVYLGGSNDISNFQPLCKSCNSWKGTKIIDFITYD